MKFRLSFLLLASIISSAALGYAELPKGSVIKYSYTNLITDKIEGGQWIITIIDTDLQKDELTVQQDLISKDGKTLNSKQDKVKASEFYGGGLKIVENCAQEGGEAKTLKTALGELKTCLKFYLIEDHERGMFLGGTYHADVPGGVAVDKVINVMDKSLAFQSSLISIEPRNQDAP